MSESLISVQHLKKYFKTSAGTLHAVDDMSFDIHAGKTLGLVGESGCGKSTTGRLLLRLLEPTAGEVWFDGQNVFSLRPNELRALRTRAQIIFQDPFSSLDPRMSIAEIIEEPLKINRLGGTKSQRLERVYHLMDLVGLAQRYAPSYPHELDGGRLQRVGIARALSMDTKFIVCDEPVSALDVSIRAQILNLLGDLQEQLGLTYLFITHDLAVVHHFSDEIIVMYLGRIVEQAPSQELFARPIHPYTEALLSAIPEPTLDKKGERIILKGELASPIDPKPGCRFAGRCPHAQGICFTKEPVLEEVESLPPGKTLGGNSGTLTGTDTGAGNGAGTETLVHRVACHLFKESRTGRP